MVVLLGSTRLLRCLVNASSGSKVGSQALYVHISSTSVGSGISLASCEASITSFKSRLTSLSNNWFPVISAIIYKLIRCRKNELLLFETWHKVLEIVPIEIDRLTPTVLKSLSLYLDPMHTQASWVYNCSGKYPFHERRNPKLLGAR